MNNKEEVATDIDEILRLEMGGTFYLKFPERFKDEFDIKTAKPILATIIREKETTKLCYFFSNDTLKNKK